MRDYPCPHCGGEGRIAEDYLDAWTPITRPCGYCEGRGHFTRPVLPRGAVRAFKVSWWERENVDDWYERARLVHAASPAKAKMVVAREMVQDWITVGGEQMAIDPVFDSIGEALRELSVRRAPEHDSSLDGATSERSA